MHHFGRAATSCAAVWMRAFIKNYVLTLLFLKYVSDKHKYGGGMIELHAGTTFDDIVKLKNTADIGDRLNKIIAQIAEEGTNQVISGGSVFMIDASRGFIKDGNKNRLREQDIHKIIDTFTNLVTAVWCI